MCDSALSFWLLEGPADQAIAWVDTAAADQAALLDSYHAAGISLVVSAFGSTDVPTSSKADPTATANSLAAWVKANNLDGVDIGKCSRTLLLLGVPTLTILLRRLRGFECVRRGRRLCGAVAHHLHHGPPRRAALRPIPHLPSS